MKKATPLKVVLVVLFLIQSCFAFSQQLTPFATRYDKDLNGDILLIGNSILNRQSTAVPTNTPNVPYNGGLLNSDSDFNMNYINIDPAVGVFNSSSANLVLPDPTCSKVVYAALY